MDDLVNVLRDHVNVLRDIALGNHDSNALRPKEVSLEGLKKQLENDRKNARLAMKHKGEKPHIRFSRAYLLLRHEQEVTRVNFEVLEDSIKTYKAIFTTEYSPSSKAFEDLKPIVLNELRVETVHSKNFIVLRTISKGLRKNGLSLVVEDYMGNCDELLLYNLNIGLNDEAFLPVNSYFAIRAPFYKLCGQAAYGICCHHPSDFLLLHDSHTFVKQLPWKYPPKHTVQFSCEALKEEGNKLFAEGKHYEASLKYNKALEQKSLKNDHPDIWVSLHSNRAVVRLNISQFEGALNDCEEVLSCQPKNKKAMHLRARAFYCLREYEKSLAACEATLAEFPKAVDPKSLRAQCYERLEESAKGDFDFIDMQTEAREKKNAGLDHADYIGPVEIRRCSAPSKGKGLFAKKNIRQGQLLICEKAFMMAYQDQEKLPVIASTIRDRDSIGSQAGLPEKIVQFIYNNPSAAGPFLKLYSGPNGKRSSEIRYTPEGNPMINSFTVNEIVEHNTLIVENTGVLVENSAKKKPKVECIYDCGIWITASYINHSCLANVECTWIGDFLIVRALRSIRKGEELVHSYQKQSKPLEERQKALKIQGFRCHCELCAVQGAASETEMENRAKALAEYDKFETTNTEKILNLNLELMPQVRKHINAIRKSYSAPIFCFGLMHPYTHLINLQFKAKQFRGCMINLREMIKLVTGCDPLADGEFEPKLWMSPLIFNFFYLCVVLEELRDTKNLAKFKEKTRILWGISSGIGYESIDIDGDIWEFRKSVQMY